MSKKLSFSIAINLLTDNFKKGANKVARGFKSMQTRALTFVAALGFGTIGLTNFMSRLIKTAKDTSRVTTSLKNASGGIGNFIGNQKFVNKLANDYKLEVNSLTENFAKFTAGATASGMALSKQKSIFESVAKATAGYNLSVEDTNGVFLALSRMMSKGKVSSRDLKIMMGDKMPIAMQAMAQSMGVPIQQLDKMMAKGKLIANDVLPAFAVQLEKMSPKIDTDNLTSSLKALENAFGDFTNAAGVESKYKTLVDSVTSIITNAAKNIKSIVSVVALGVFFVIVNGAVKMFRSLDLLAMSQVDKTKGLHAKLVTAEAKKNLELVNLERLRLQQSAASGQARIKLAEKVYIAEKNFGKAVIAEEKARVALAQASATAKVGIATRALNVVKIAFSKLFLTLKSLWNTFAPAIIITALASIVMYFKNIYDEAKRIKKIFSDYKKEADRVGNTQEVVMLQKQLAIMNDKTKSQQEVNAAQSALNKMLGTELSNQKELNNRVAKRINLLKEAARADFFAQKIVTTEDKIQELASSLGLSEDHVRKLAKTRSDLGNGSTLDIASKSKGKDSYFNQIGEAYRASGVKGKYDASATDHAIKEVVELMRVLDDANTALEGSVSKANEIQSVQLNGPDDSELKKADKIAKELLELKDKNAQSLIDLEENIRAKRLAQIELDYNREIATIKKKEKEWQAAQNNKLSSDQEETIASSLQLANDKKIKATENSEKEILAILLKSKVEYLKEYGSYQQQKLAIAEEYAHKISEAEKEGNKFEADRLRKDEQSSIASVEVAAIKAEIDWQSVLGDLGLMIEDQLRPTLERLKAYAKSDDFKNATFEDQKLIYDAINKLEKQTSGGLNKKMFNDVANDIQNYQNSLQSLVVAKEKEEATITALTKANEKLKNALESNNPEVINSAQAEVDSAKSIFNQAADSVVNLTQENNEHAENLKNSSANTIGALHNLEDGLNNLSSGSLKNAMLGLGTIGEAMGGKVGDALSKAFAGKGIVGEIIAAVIGILDVLKDGVGTLISGLIDTVLNAVDGILSNILTGKMFEQIGVSLFNGVRSILSTISFGVFSSHGNAKEVNNLVKNLTNSNKYLITAIEKLTDEMSKSGGLKSTIYYGAALNKQKDKIENDRKMLEAKMGYNSSHHSNNYYIKKAFNAEDWKKASDYVGKQISSVGDLWKLSPEDLAKLQELPDIWEKIHSGKYDQSDWLAEYVKDANTLIELTEQWQDAITDTTFDSIKGELKDLLSDFKVTTEDALESVEEFMRNAILHSISSGTYADELKDWQAEFAKAMQDGVLSDDEADYLRKKYQNIFDQALIDRDAAYKAAGIEDLEESKRQDSTKGYSTAMDQDTGGSILGRVTGIAESVIEIRTMLGNVTNTRMQTFTQINLVHDELKKQTDIIYEMQQVQMKNYNLNKEMNNNLSALEDIKEDINSINRNTKGLAPR